MYIDGVPYGHQRHAGSTALGPDMEITTNAARASAKGVELEISIRPVLGLTLFAGVGYNDTCF